eukprot:2254576-Alexandrium_andersonii.AAC.1
MRALRIIAGTRNIEAKPTLDTKDSQLQKDHAVIHVKVRVVVLRLLYLPRATVAGPPALKAMLQATDSWLQQ